MDRLNILHIAAIENNPFNGVCIAAPQHVISQKEYATTGLINIKNIKIDALKDYPGTQMDFNKPFDINRLAEPFNKPDVAVFHECYRIEYLQIAVNLKRNGIPYIIMPHGELRKEAQKKKHLKKVVANVLLFNYFINNAIAIQCLSQMESDNTNFGKKKFIGTNGIDAADRHKKEFSSQGLKLLYIGRLEVYTKGLDILIEAISIKKDLLINNNCTLEIYGPDRSGRFEQVRSLIKENQVEDIVDLHHEIEGEEKINKLLDSDIFIQTSRFEGMPLGLLEALSYGLPCIVTKGTTLADDIEKHQLGWSGDDTAESIAEAIERSLTQKEELSIIGRSASEYIRNNYEWSVVSKKNVESIKSLLEKNT